MLLHFICNYKLHISQQIALLFFETALAQMLHGNFGGCYSIIKYQVCITLCFEYCERDG